MRQRCTNPNIREYPYYGGRGIRVCARWAGKGGFKNFIADLGPQPFPRASVNRLDNNGNYTPSNVVWADAKAQARNMRTNHLIEYGGETKVLAEWAEILGMKPGTLSARLGKGWSVHKAFAKPVIQRRPFTPWPSTRKR